ncbi:MAG: hypothetical protein APF76_10060 [Desulfitibacter sp. BRH_c19]|nr:MAG: hypothetical protein APF76_10060 [Desulfitibacter sp. BRH_c19]
MIDLRYHIATVIALFLALGIGIFIGSTVISDGVLIKEQEQLIVLLEKEFDKLRDDNRFLRSNVLNLQENLNTYDELGKEVFPIIAGQRLTDKRVGVLVTNPDFSPEEFIGALTETGVEKVFEITISKDFYDHNQVELIVPDLINTITKKLKPLDHTIMAEELVESEFISISGNFTVPADYLLIVGGGTTNNSLDFAKLLDYPLIKEIMNLGISIIGVEPTNVEFSYMPTYKALGIPTVEKIDTFIGKLKLIKLLEE